ncbi:Omp28-related outer membrane protein [Chitinophagaceae bacterium MMS25-I14]
MSGLIALSSCKEVLTPVPHNNGNTGVSIDTTYTTTPEDTTVRKVLVEEFTGVTCPNCPQGHTLIKGYETSYPGRIVAIGYYTFGLSQTEPVAGLSQQDFRNNISTDLGNYFGGIPLLPSGTIDRIPPNGGSLLDDRNFWSAMVSTRLNAPTPLNVHVTSAYDPSSRTDTITVTVAVTKAITKKLALSVSIIENNIIDAQEDVDHSGNALIDTMYQHNHVIRDMLTPVSGTPIFTSYDGSSKAPGLVYRHVYVYTVNNAWKPENCKVIAFVNNNETNDKEVAQAEETDMK